MTFIPKTCPSILIHLPPTLYNFFLPVLQFSPVSIIPPLLHTHSSIYHPRCIIFFSQYFSFPLSVSFHHCSILNHPSTNHTLYCFSPSTSVFLSLYHSIPVLFITVTCCNATPCHLSQVHTAPVWCIYKPAGCGTVSASTNTPRHRQSIWRPTVSIQQTN